MRHAVMAGIVLGVVCTAGIVEAKDRPIERLPGDVWSLAMVWTEPIKEVAKQTRQFDPISGLWFGLVAGSVKSVERTAKFFLPQNQDNDTPGPTYKGGKAILRYTF